MTVQDTSLAAYADLRASLNQRQWAVWIALRDYSMAPTAYELFRSMQESDPALDLNDVRPRLTEMRATGHVRKCGKRCCRVTGKLATTWEAVRGRPPQAPTPKPVRELYDANAPREGSLF